jgi:hypothetical protein
VRQIKQVNHAELVNEDCDRVNEEVMLPSDDDNVSLEEAALWAGRRSHKSTGEK